MASDPKFKHFLGEHALRSPAPNLGLLLFFPCVHHQQNLTLRPCQASQCFSLTLILTVKARKSLFTVFFRILAGGDYYFFAPKGGDYSRKAITVFQILLSSSRVKYENGLHKVLHIWFLG